MDLSVFVSCLEENLYILGQARNLCGYGIASGQDNGIYVQISQRIQTCIGGLNQLVADIRAIPKKKTDQVAVDPATLLPFLTTSERADLGQLEHSFNELTITRDLVDLFRRRLYDLGIRRRQAGDLRND